jgi:hypothetical protein
VQCNFLFHQLLSRFSDLRVGEVANELVSAELQTLDAKFLNAEGHKFPLKENFWT